jgi:diaminopimelate decarboxylase
MSGPFGMDPDLLDSCRSILAESTRVRLRGIHAHLASGLEAPAMLQQSSDILARPWSEEMIVVDPEFNLGGGMAVDYAAPERKFDWADYAKGIAGLARPGETLRIEPGRALSVYSGWYVTEVLDIKKAYGGWYAVLRGDDTYPHACDQAAQSAVRCPATPQGRPHAGRRIGDPPGSALHAEGRVRTRRDSRVAECRRRRRVSMAGAYSWNISHHDFLMHPKPGFHYLED